MLCLWVRGRGRAISYCAGDECFTHAPMPVIGRAEKSIASRNRMRPRAPPVPSAVAAAKRLSAEPRYPGSPRFSRRVAPA